MLLNRENLEGIYTSLVESQKQESDFLTIGEDDVTEVDVTGISAGDELSHSHIWVEEHDATNHWRYCKICKREENRTPHEFGEKKWILGYESCDITNGYTRFCSSCGYQETGQKPCEWDGISYQSYTSGSGWHYKKCKNHGTFIGGKEYYYNGTLYYEPWIDGHGAYCVYSDGNRLHCGTSGTCAICGGYFDGKHMLTGYDGKIYCKKCNNEYGTYSVTVSRKQVENENIVLNEYEVNLQLEGGGLITDPSGFMAIEDNLGYADFLSGEMQDNQYYKSRKCEWINNSTETNGTIKITLESNTFKTQKHLCLYVYLNREDILGVVDIPLGNIISDITKPTVEVKIGEKSDNNWEKSKKIEITGSENFSDYVTISVEDENHEIVYTGTATVSEKSYNISFTPAIEADEKERKYKVTVTDQCNNSETGEFSVSKVDNTAPKMKSETKTVEEWSKYKEVIIVATDEGIGQVQISFNNTDNYKLGVQSENEYSRKYRFIGDVYGNVSGAIYLKDGLENSTTEFIDIYNLDNTEPTIKGTLIENDKIIVIANDKNTTLNAEGSGIERFKIITKYGQREITVEELQANANSESLQNMQTTEEGDKTYIFNLLDFAGLNEIQIIPIDLVGNEGQVVTVKLPNIKSSVITNVGTSKINDKEQKVSYEIEYKAELENYTKALTVTITDILPYVIDKERTDIKTDLDDGTYDETDKKITWTEKIEENTEMNIAKTSMSDTDANIKDEIDENGIRTITVTKNITIAFKGIDPTGKNFTSTVRGNIELEWSKQSEETEDVTYETKTEFTKVIKITKIWEHGNNKYEKPKKIKLQVKNVNELGKVVEEFIVGEKENWTHVFTDLPKYDVDGNEIEYTVDEEEIEGEDLDYYKKEIK